MADSSNSGVDSSTQSDTTLLDSKLCSLAVENDRGEEIDPFGLSASDSGDET